MTWSENALHEIASVDPERFVALVTSGTMDAVSLSLAAEIAGISLPREQVISILMPLLSDGRALVREGALYGLSQCRDDVSVMAAIRQHTDPATEPSAAIREIAADILFDVETYGP
jgi:HEAT repeat protein